MEIRRIVAEHIRRCDKLQKIIKSREVRYVPIVVKTQRVVELAPSCRVNSARKVSKTEVGRRKGMDRAELEWRKAEHRVALRKRSVVLS